MAKLPSHFEKYMDEKFAHTNDSIKGVEKELKRMNGDVKAVKKEQLRVAKAQLKMVPIFTDTVKRSKRNSKAVRVMGIGILLGSVIWIKESRDLILKTVLSFFAGGW